MLNTNAISALNEVLLQAALRAERVNADKAADQRARAIALHLDAREKSQ